MNDTEFLTALRDHIELTQVQLEAEFGCKRSLEELIADRDMPEVYAEVLRRLAADPSVWTRSADRLPMQEDSPSGYYWGWNQNAPKEPPELLEAWTEHGFPMGFRREAGGIVEGITHWTPATPPATPVMMKDQHLSPGG